MRKSQSGIAAASQAASRGFDSRLSLQMIKTPAGRFFIFGERRERKNHTSVSSKKTPWRFPRAAGEYSRHNSPLGVFSFSAKDGERKNHTSVSSKKTPWRFPRAAGEYSRHNSPLGVFSFSAKDGERKNHTSVSSKKTPWRFPRAALKVRKLPDGSLRMDSRIRRSGYEQRHKSDKPTVIQKLGIQEECIFILT